jgi:hypothetical protein
MSRGVEMAVVRIERRKRKSKRKEWLPDVVRAKYAVGGVVGRSQMRFRCLYLPFALDHQQQHIFFANADIFRRVVLETPP